MPQVFKRKGRSDFYFTYTDANGKRRWKSTGTTEKSVAEDIAAKARSDARMRSVYCDPEQERFRELAESSISEHLENWSQALRTKNISERHTRDSVRQVQRLIDDQTIQTLGDLSADCVVAYLGKLVDAGLSARTVEANLQPVKAFVKWLLRNKRLPFDPLVSVEKPKTNGGRERARRALEHAEWDWLDTTTRQAGIRFGMSGLERALLYATAIQTGLRSNELRALTRASLSLSSKQPFVSVDARHTKNRKRAKQYIQPELAIELQNHTRHKAGAAPVFSMPSKYRVADMLRADLAEARGAWLQSFTDPQERIEADASDFLRAVDSQTENLDFHALRHTTATWLIQAGADVKVVQSVMRHSTIKLTLDLYGHLFEGAEAEAVSMLRDRFTDPSRSTQRATGTDEVMATPGTQKNFKPVRNPAISCETESGQKAHFRADAESHEPRFPNENIGNSSNRPRRIRTFDLRIRNQVPTNENIGDSGAGHAWDTISTNRNLPERNALGAMLVEFPELVEALSGLQYLAPDARRHAVAEVVAMLNALRA
jgi:site-specific recombinase XerD